jgi:hypothetical protein
MSSLSSKDRVSLCRFTFDDGRRCRTPRISTSPDFCFYHAKKEAQLRANEKIGNDLAFFFSSDYLSANDLNTALSRVFVAVARGDIKPRAARTLAYLAQTMLQTLHLAQNELISACGEKDWRETVVTSINDNHDYRFPRPIEPSAQSAPPQTQITPQPSALSQPPTTPPPNPPKPANPPQACHPDQSEGPRLDSAPSTTTETRPVRSPAPAHTLHTTSSPVGAGLARPDSPSALPDSQPAAEPKQSATQTRKPSAPAAAQPAPPPRATTQTRDPYAVHYGPNHRLIVDGKPF